MTTYRDIAADLLSECEDFEALPKQLTTYVHSCGGSCSRSSHSQLHFEESREPYLKFAEEWVKRFGDWMTRSEPSVLKELWDEIPSQRVVDGEIELLSESERSELFEDGVSQLRSQLEGVFESMSQRVEELGLIRVDDDFNLDETLDEMLEAPASSVKEYLLKVHYLIGLLSSALQVSPVYLWITLQEYDWEKLK